MILHLDYNSELLTKFIVVRPHIARGIVDQEVTQVRSGVDFLQRYTMEELDGAVIGWAQEGPYLYLRLPAQGEFPSVATSYPWLVDATPFEDKTITTDIEDKYGIVNNFAIERSSDDISFDQMTLPSFTVQVANDRLEDPEGIIGRQVNFRIPELDVTETMQCVDVRRGLSKTSLVCKDIRELSELVVDQQDRREDDLNAGGNVVMDADVALEHKKDAVGYCFDVPTDCLNGYAFDTQDYRIYRVGYGSFEPDEVEIQQDDRWGQLEEYTIEEITEVLPSGEQMLSQVIKVDALVAHPPRSGSVEPDYDSAPRKIRVTGLFHSERPGIEKVRGVLAYLFDRYSSRPFTGSYFNLSEIYDELDFAETVGVFIDEPTALGEVIERLQNGCTKGWQLCTHNGKLTVRKMDYRRPRAYRLKSTEVLNEDSLELDFEGSRAVSLIKVLYAQSYTEDRFREYQDRDINRELTNVHRIIKPQEIETLLKEEADARARLRWTADNYSFHLPRVNGLQVHGREFFGLRQYDIIEYRKGQWSLWYVLNVRANVESEVVELDIKAVSLMTLEIAGVLDCDTGFSLTGFADSMYPSDTFNYGVGELVC